MNSVTITGILNEYKEGKYRELEYDTPFSDNEFKENRKIKVKYWASQTENRLLMAPINARALIHGHLEEHKIFGTILLIEELELIG